MDSRSQMKEMLELWNVEILSDKLDGYGFDIKNLECIDEEDLKTIFCEKQFYGPVKRFRIMHSNWLKTLMQHDLEDCCLSLELQTLDSRNQMKELLKLWNVEILNDVFNGYGFDIKSIECVDDEDLKNMFCEKEYYGPVKRFRVMHSKWLKTLKSGPTATEPTLVTADEPQRSRQSATESTLASTNEPREDRDSSDSSNHNETFNLNGFLKKSDDALALIRRYEKNKNFSPDERLELVGIIAEQLVKMNFKMSVGRFYDISNQISLIFVHEDKDTYYGNFNGRKSGILSIAYYNRLAAAKKKKRKRESSSELVAESANLMNDEVKAAMEWMKKNNPVDEEDEDAEECLSENWKYSFKYRNEAIKNLNGNVEEIFNMWPALKNSYLLSLVEDDFQAIFGNDLSHFKDGWNTFARRNIRNIRKMVAEPDVKRILNDLANGEDEGTNFYNIEVILALLHLMEPSTVVLKNGKRYHATIESAKSRLLKLVDDKSLIEGFFTLAKKDRVTKQLEMYPMIFGVGESNESVSEFILRLGELSLKFFTFVEAVDASFKCYIYFKIPFSPEHKRFWTLLNGIFYKIKTPTLDITAPIKSYINSFDK